MIRSMTGQNRQVYKAGVKGVLLAEPWMSSSGTCAEDRRRGMRRYPDATGGDSRGSEQLDGRDSRGSHPVTHYASGPRHWVSGGIDGRFDLAGKGVFEV